MIANAAAAKSAAKSAAGQYLAPPPLISAMVDVGASVETQQYGLRVDRLREVPAAVRFVSIESLQVCRGTPGTAPTGCDGGQGK
jgi:hypothetical protein